MIRFLLSPAQNQIPRREARSECDDIFIQKSLIWSRETPDTRSSYSNRSFKAGINSRLRRGSKFTRRPERRCYGFGCGVRPISLRVFIIFW
jgi:hypothetical protein